MNRSIIKTRFDNLGETENAINRAMVDGREVAYWYYHDKGYIRDHNAWIHFLKEVTGDEEFGLHRLFSSSLGGDNEKSAKTWADELVEALANKILRTEEAILAAKAREIEQNRMIENLKAEIVYLKESVAKRPDHKLAEIMEKCLA